jgi:HPr kinase/phosphorylase
MGTTATTHWHSLHGVLLVVRNSGVLLTGPSGCGKSSLALELIATGHTLLSDDAPLLRVTQEGRLEGCCPPLLHALLHVRGLGVINVARLYGEQAVTERHVIDLWIQLGNTSPSFCEPTHATHLQQTLLFGVRLPMFQLPMTPGLNRATWIECAVRLVQQTAAGLHNSHELAHRQDQLLRGNASCV